MKAHKLRLIPYKNYITLKQHQHYRRSSRSLIPYKNYITLKRKSKIGYRQIAWYPIKITSLSNDPYVNSAAITAWYPIKITSLSNHETANAVDVPAWYPIKITSLSNRSWGSSQRWQAWYPIKITSLSNGRNLLVPSDHCLIPYKNYITLKPWSWISRQTQSLIPYKNYITLKRCFQG